jgi:hypothetical protein
MDMKQSLWVWCLVLTGFLIPETVFAQDSRIANQPVELQVAGSALLAVAGPPVSLKLAGAVQAGEAVGEEVENNDTRLRISSLVNDEESRSITATISETLIGTQLFVDLQEPNVNFVHPENKGTLKGSQLLSNGSEITLVEGIKTCWSGKTDGDGYVINYTFKVIPNAPVLKSANVTVTYTITLVPSDLETQE